MNAKWVKTGGWDQSDSVTYTAGEWQIIRTKICGAWTQPAVYRNGRFVIGFRTISEAKSYVERQGRPLIEVL